MFAMLALLLFPALMAFAALFDVFTMTIPNRVSLALVSAYVLISTSYALPLHAVALNLSCALVILTLTFGLFCMGWIGGGDAKLTAATALWLGWENLFDYAVAASIAGGLLTLCIISLRFAQLPERLLRIGFVARLADKANGVPYGVALAAAGLLVYPRTMEWAVLSGV